MRQYSPVKSGSDIGDAPGGGRYHTRAPQRKRGLKCFVHLHSEIEVLDQQYTDYFRGVTSDGRDARNLKTTAVKNDASFFKSRSDYTTCLTLNS